MVYLYIYLYIYIYKIEIHKTIFFLGRPVSAFNTRPQLSVYSMKNKLFIIATKLQIKLKVIIYS